MEAYKWLSLASAQGDGGTKRLVSKIEKEMTPDQISEGMRLASEFRPPQASGRKTPSWFRRSGSEAQAALRGSATFRTWMRRFRMLGSCHKRVAVSWKPGSGF